MLDVFVKKSTEEMQVRVELSDGHVMLLGDLVQDYERLLNEEALKKAAISGQKDSKSMKSELKVGEWYLINWQTINERRMEIRLKCKELGAKGMELLHRFEESNRIADANPDQYPRLIEVYIFEHSWGYKTEEEMRKMCEDVGEGMCDKVICDLELQMRICNGEDVYDLVNEPDKLPRVRVIQLRDGGTGYFGGGADDGAAYPAADLVMSDFRPNRRHYNYTPYAFRRVFWDP